MSRPPKFRNPLSRWLVNRRHRQKQLEETAAKLVTSEIPANALNLAKELVNVDFIHSQLPEYILNDRQNEAVRPEICSLEWTTRGLIQLLREDSQAVNMDLRPIDQKLMMLALMLQDFVAHGDATAARAAADALQVGILEIRCKLPLFQPDLAEAFVRENAGYLEKWITLVGLAQSYDHICCNLASANAALREAEQEHQDTMAYIDQRIVNEPDFAEAFFYIRDHDTPADRIKWTKTQHEVHMLLIYAKVEAFCVNLKAQQPIALENHKMAARQQLDTLRTCLTILPNVADPHLMDRYQETMYQFIKAVIESDQRMEETLHFIEELTAATEELTDAFEKMDAAMEKTLNAAEELNSARVQLDQGNPVLVNKYNEVAMRYIEAVTASDQRIEEALNVVEKLTAAVGQLNHDLD